MYRYLLVLVAIVFPFVEAKAYKPAPPRSYQITSSDGKFLFAMVSHQPIEDELKHFREETQKEILEVRERWPKSGMYRNDGSRDPLWIVDWYAYKVDVPSGGDFVIRYSSGGWYWLDQPKLAFYKRGELLRAYEMPELVAFDSLISHGDWLDEARLDDEALLLHLTTETFDRYTFDVHTGEMTTRVRPLVYAFRLLVLLAILLPIWWIRRRRRRIALESR